MLENTPTRNAFCRVGTRSKIASLFSGCGGLDLGFLGGFEFGGLNYPENSVEIVFANDFDADASTCYNANKLLTRGGNAECLLADIRNVEASAIPDYDILLAGFPCQPFSNAGNRKGVNDKNGRGTLFEECERILKAKIDKGAKPKAFVFENVRGILSSKMASGITVPEEIRNRMEALGYNISMRLVCAQDYGVPQARFRVLIIGVSSEIPAFDFDEMKAVVEEGKIPSVAFGSHEQLLLGNVIRGLEGLPDGEAWAYTASMQKMVDLIGPCKFGKKGFDYFEGGGKAGSLPKELREGRSWKDIPPALLPSRFRRIYDDPKRYHAPKFYRRFALGEINGTITASAQPENCGITHPFENRRYTVREIARIQSFPDNYEFGSIPLQSRYKVIGNAVPPVLGTPGNNHENGFATAAVCEREVRPFGRELASF